MGFGVRAPCVERVRAFGRAGRAWDTRQYIGQHLGCASGVAYPFAEQGPNGRLSLSCVAHSVGEMVLCPFVRTGVFVAGIFAFSRRLAGAPDQWECGDGARYAGCARHGCLACGFFIRGGG